MKPFLLIVVLAITGCCTASAVTARPTTGEIVRSHESALLGCQPDGSACTALATLAVRPVDIAATDDHLYLVDGSSTLRMCDRNGGSCSDHAIGFGGTGVAAAASEQVTVVGSGGEVAACNPNCTRVTSPP